MIALIGAGPLGLEMAVGLKRNGLEYVHFEAGPIGATMAWWAPGTRWFSSNDRIAIAGVPLVTPNQDKATREEYLAYLRGIVEQFGLEVRTYTRVLGIERLERGESPNAGGHAKSMPRFAVRHRHALLTETPVVTTFAAKIILATGGTAAPRLLGVEGEDLAHVSHYFGDPHMYFRKRVVIVGGRNSAVEAALRCQRAGAHVTLVHRGGDVDVKDIKYWLYPEFSGLVKARRIATRFGGTVRRIIPEGVVLDSEEVLEADFVLLLTGYRADMSLARGLGVELSGSHQAPCLDPATMETNVPGVYMVGTVTAGSQGGQGRGYQVFMENCHVHVGRVVAHLLGQPAPAEHAERFERPES